MIKKLLLVLSIPITLQADPFAQALAEHAQGKPASLLLLAVKEMRDNRNLDAKKVEELFQLINGNPGTTSPNFPDNTHLIKIQDLESRVAFMEKAMIVGGVVVIAGGGYLAYRKNV